MSKHSTTLVPIDTWCYASPELKFNGRKVDMGIFAEALLYYDEVIIAPSTPEVFLDFIIHFYKNSELDILFNLLNNGSLKIYDYAFIATGIEHKGEYSIWNVQDAKQEKPNSFEERYLYNESIDKLFPKGRHRKKFYDTIRGNYTEVKAFEFNNAIENARADYGNASRHELIAQVFINELYNLKKLGSPPEIKVSVERTENEKNILTWNIDFKEIAKIAGTNLNFNIGTPFTALANSNKLIWSAAKIGCDLYLPSPITKVVMDKLDESTSRTIKPSSIIKILEKEVEFPDIRKLINSEILTFKDIVEIRKKSKNFRNWIQDESERDRNALFAYQNEVNIESGLSKFGKKSLSAFGVVGGGTAGGVIGSLIAGPIGGAIGGGVGSGIPYLMDLALKIDENWKPVIFGNWLIEYVEKKK